MTELGEILDPHSLGLEDLLATLRREELIYAPLLLGHRADVVILDDPASTIDGDLMMATYSSHHAAVDQSEARPPGADQMSNEARGLLIDDLIDRIDDLIA